MPWHAVAGWAGPAGPEYHQHAGLAELAALEPAAPAGGPETAVAAEASADREVTAAAPSAN